MINKNLLTACTLTCMLTLTSCSTIKIPSTVNGSKADGIVKLAYDYSFIEAPKVQWDLAQLNAKDTCVGWGYTDAKRFDSKEKRCTKYDSNNTCLNYQVILTYQCIN